MATLLALLRHWKTTLPAVGIALVELGRLLQGDVDVNWDMILAAVGLFFAGDASKSK